VQEYLRGSEKGRNGKWTESIAVGSRPFAEKVKALLGIRAKGRAIVEGTEVPGSGEIFSITLFFGPKSQI
jgi:hypothetical protein